MYKNLFYKNRPKFKNMLRTHPRLKNGRELERQKIIWNQQIVDSATLFATRAKDMDILKEQFAGLVILSFPLPTCISNIDSRIICFRASFL